MVLINRNKYAELDKKHLRDIQTKLLKQSAIFNTNHRIKDPEFIVFLDIVENLIVKTMVEVQNPHNFESL